MTRTEEMCSKVFGLLGLGECTEINSSHRESVDVVYATVFNRLKAENRLYPVGYVAGIVAGVTGVRRARQRGFSIARECGYRQVFDIKPYLWVLGSGYAEKIAVVLWEDNFSEKISHVLAAADYASGEGSKNYVAHKYALAGSTMKKLADKVEVKYEF